MLTSLLILSANADSLRYAEDQSPAIINPLFTTTMSEARIDELIFEGLFTDSKELATTPMLAEAFTLAEDGLSMELSVRQDVQWHDGHRFDAEDVVFTISALKNPATLSTESGRVSWIEAAEQVDTYTVKLTFTEPQARPEDKLFFKILPAHAFQGTTVKRTDPFRTAPIGTGSFRLDRYNEDNSITLSRFADHRTGGRIPEIVMREVSDKNYQAKLLVYESLEALVRVLPRDLAVLQNNRGVELYPYQTNSWWYLGFNQNRAPFNDVAVRQAISSLVDVEALLAPVGTGDVLSGPFVRSSPYYNHDVQPYGHDPSTAATLLESAGYALEGTRWTKGGQPLSMRISAHKSLESAQEVVINLQSQLQSAGIKVEVDFLDEAAWKSSIWSERDYDVILSQWSFDRNEDVREQFHSRGSRNFTGYTSEAVDALLETARTTRDPQEKKAALRALHAAVHEDAPMVFLWTLDSYSAMSARVKSVVIHPFYYFTWAGDWRM
ncbi:MAG: peptide/nickel transport system substrate-binding protein [Myxococcota bacterium]|jgi:peptide/nickel transport system substrate-binding protein